MQDVVIAGKPKEQLEVQEGELRYNLLVWMRDRDEFVVKQQLLIQQQLELMVEIQSKITNPKSIDLDLSLKAESNSSRSKSAHEYDETSSRSKFAYELQASMLDSALQEVRSVCSTATYNAIHGYVSCTRKLEYDLLNKKMIKKTKQLDHCSLLLILKGQEILKLKEEINHLTGKLNVLEEEKKRWKRKDEFLAEKQARLHKAEIAFVMREKLQQQSKKRHQKANERYLQSVSQMRTMTQGLKELWEQILTQMNNASKMACCISEGSCWKKDVMRKCRDKILEERSILQKEEMQMEQEYHKMMATADQLKKLIEDPALQLSQA